MYIYTPVHVYIHKCMDIRIDLYLSPTIICTCTHTYICTRMNVCVCACVCACARFVECVNITHIHVDVNTYRYSCGVYCKVSCACIYIYMCIYPISWENKEHAQGKKKRQYIFSKKPQEQKPYTTGHPWIPNTITCRLHFLRPTWFWKTQSHLYLFCHWEHKR